LWIDPETKVIRATAGETLQQIYDATMEFLDESLNEPTMWNVTHEVVGRSYSWGPPPQLRLITMEVVTLRAGWSVES
jgi:hypothetical protein